MPIPIATGGASPGTVESWIRDIQHNQHMTQQMNAINRVPAIRGGEGGFTRTRSRGADATKAIGSGWNPPNQGRG